MFQELQSKLEADLKQIGIAVGFKLILKPYSSSMYGKYSVASNTIILYVYQDAEKKFLYPYFSLLETLVHEAVHYVQWCDPAFKRYRGIMHDTQFKTLYAAYMQRIQMKGLIVSDD